jgi:beta-glucanase (GH16 family)
MKLTILFILSSFLSFAQVMWDVKTYGAFKWYYQFGDEFTGDTLDNEKWRIGLPWGNAVMSQDLIFDSKSIELKDGILKLKSNKEENQTKLEGWQIDSSYIKKSKLTLNKQLFDSHFTAGLISSQQKFKTGFFEIRFKNTGQKGTWPAFWLYGGNPNDEIDIFELKGERDNEFHVDVHCPKGCDNYKKSFFDFQRGWGTWLKTKQSLSTSWNIISAEWQGHFVKICLNGKPVAFFKGAFKTDQFLILNNSVAKNGGAFSPGPDNTTQWPNSFDIDYVRVWSNKDTIQRLQNNHLIFKNSDISLSENNLYETELIKNNKRVYYKENFDYDVAQVTLLPISYNKYSLSILGKQLGQIQIDIYDYNHIKVAGFKIANINYYVLDLSHLPTGPYEIQINIATQRLIHNIPIINPEKIGEQ